MYALVALFDQNTERIIKDIWKSLEDKGISDYAKEVEDRVPHITIASYKELSVDYFTKHIGKYYENRKSIPISFQSIGSFRNTKTLYYAPIVTAELLMFHQEYHGTLRNIMTVLILYICQVNGFHTVL